MTISRSLAATLLVLATAAAAQTKPATKPEATKPAAAAAAAAPAAAAALPEGVKSDPEKEAAGKLAAEGFLIVLDRRDWGGAWERSSEMFRKKVPLAAWMDGIPKAREPLGALVERAAVATAYKTSLPGYPDGHYVTVFFESKYEKKADVREAITTVREADGKWRITGYQAQ